MKKFKTFLTYFLWTLLSISGGFVHMRIVLGPRPEPTTGLRNLFNWGWDMAFLYVGFIIGCIIALLYLLIEIFIFRKKLPKSNRSNLIRLLTIVALSIIVGVTHYVLEIVVDVL